MPANGPLLSIAHSEELKALQGTFLQIPVDGPPFRAVIEDLSYCPRQRIMRHGFDGLEAALVNQRFADFHQSEKLKYRIFYASPRDEVFQDDEGMEIEHATIKGVIGDVVVGIMHREKRSGHPPGKSQP